MKRKLTKKGEANDKLKSMKNRGNKKMNNKEHTNKENNIQPT